MSILKKLLLSAPAIVIAVTIFILSNSPHPGLPELGIEWEDKIMHISAYFAFGIALVLFFVVNLQVPEIKKVAFITIFIGSFYGLTDEFHQYFIPGRSSEILDWIADVLGVLLSVTTIKFLKIRLLKPVS